MHVLQLMYFLVQTCNFLLQLLNVLLFVPHDSMIYLPQL